ncbi:MAG: hypothetical protein ACQESK_02165 [Bacteroidota bacterium]
MLAYILASIMMFQFFQLEINYLSNWEELNEHYEFHQEKYGDSFWTFIDLHYGKHQKDHQNEHSEHDNLPVHECTHAFHQVMLVNEIDFKIQFPLQNPQNTEVHYYKNLFDSLILSTVFQPPKNFDVV